MAAKQKDEQAIEIARSHNHIPWCEEYEKMISGMLFNAGDEKLANSRSDTRLKTLDYNQFRAPKMDQETLGNIRTSMLENLLGKIGKNVAFEPPFTVDYGCNVSIGDFVFANFNMVILDSGLVRIGNRVLFGPSVSILAASHETSIKSRRKGVELGLPVTIGDDCWIGGNVVILGGVTIGDGCTIGAGSVVTRNIPAYSVAVGSPARVIKKVLTPEEEEDELDPSET